MSDRLIADGCELLAAPLEAVVVRELRGLTDSLVIGSGLRGALKQLPIAGQPMRELACRYLGAGARAVRSILFDKTADSNWLVPWHQDLTIAVRERHDVDGWGPWSVKGGVTHVQPPVSVLESMLTLRLHLDDTPAENGALRVVPGSHRHGVIDVRRAAELRERGGEVTCAAGVGDVLLIRPLLLHASSKSTKPGRRRVLHVEYAAGELKWPLA